MSQEPGSSLVTKVLLRQSIASFRLVIGLYTVTSAATKLLYDQFLPELRDFDQIRWSIIGLGIVLFAFTFVRFKRRIIVPAFSLLLYLATLLYVIAYVTVNQFDPYTVIILLLVYGTSSVVINSLTYYGLQCVITVVICGISYLIMGLENGNIIGFLDILVAMAVFGVVMTVRLKMVTDIRSSHASLEKLNVLSIVANKSGGIVFVSPSIKSLLGYTPNELLRDGWWSSELRDGWISRDYIVNYPNIVPKEITSIERVLLAKGGEKVWLNWENSILPNGNYMGVGFNITKYKQQR
jgi:PAS domain S-box-containing protein